MKILTNLYGIYTRNIEKEGDSLEGHIIAQRNSTIDDKEEETIFQIPLNPLNPNSTEEWTSKSCVFRLGR